MEADKYATTYCVYCHQKTPWKGEPCVQKTKNGQTGLRGVCCKCSKNKFSFVSKGYTRASKCKYLIL